MIGDIIQIAYKHVENKAPITSKFAEEYASLRAKDGIPLGHAYSILLETLAQERKTLSYIVSGHRQFLNFVEDKAFPNKFLTLNSRAGVESILKTVIEYATTLGMSEFGKTKIREDLENCK